MPGKATKGQRTVKIPVGLDKAVEEFLKTKTAEDLGLDSKSDVVSEALRELFKQYKSILEKKSSHA